MGLTSKYDIVDESDYAGYQNLNPSTQKVILKSNRGFPKDKAFGFSIDHETLIIQKVEKDGWAAKHTWLKEYIGWRLCKINDTVLHNFIDYSYTKKLLPVGEPVEFTLEKPFSKYEIYSVIIR